MKIKNPEIKQKGYDLARGMVHGIVDEIWPVLLVVLVWLAIANTLDWFIDDSDDGGWNRSRMNIHTDHKTGIQYLSTSNGGMIRRAEK